jgi:YggT family protein
MSGLLAVGYFLFALLFSLLAFVLWTRIALRYYRISVIHPISQTIYSLTNPIVIPFSHMFPTKKTHPSRYDWPCFCALVIVELLKFIAIGALFLGAMLPLSFLPLYTLADLIVQPCNLLFYAILIRVIMSWVNPNWHHPLADILYRITEPLLQWGRRFVPVIGGIDFSSVVILILLKIITLFISASLPLPLI